MSLITLFSAPKPFTDLHIAAIQRNAIKSWTLLPDADILLLGEEDGLAEAAGELGVKHLPNTIHNASGTPLISSMFQLARENSNSDMFCIINTDILLLPDFIDVAKQVQKQTPNFVLLSQRWDVDVLQPLDFSAGWQDRLRSAVQNQGQLHRPAGSDFFLFPKTCYTDIPDFAIGRAGWDNWMIYKARQSKWPVIDCTPSLMIVHQNHDYSHLPDGKPHYGLPETDTNMQLAGGPAVVRYTILDATHRLRDGRLVRPAFTSLHFWRKVELFLRKVFVFLPESAIENIVRPRRWKKRVKRLIKP